MTMASSNTLIPVDDGFNEYESALKRQKSTTSKVWDEMTKLECENKNELKAQSSESAFSMGKKVITPLRSSLKPKTVQAVVCLDDWMRAKGFSAEIGCKKDDDDNDDDEDDEDDDVSSVAF
ncbi:hypothetical protein V6Z12_D12G072400 [Gossypium hirsutum]|uniref:Uncharacterized protein LOC107945749 n=1 Tax=Gossypium hirsutum TaxID=3635 RepID=A0A1U8N8D7_GOSHI|nr:uncharacterized protein LOC107945749 [Gossypium hirsutum]XP_016735348.1 uncharacterized protein LOC107945749 [Gossypium hirsutum]